VDGPVLRRDLDVLAARLARAHRLARRGQDEEREHGKRPHVD
jgi:hypothetical protein